MNINNKLTIKFLDAHPGDAARILEQLPDKSVTTFLDDIPPLLAAKVIELMITPFAVKYLQNVQETTTAAILEHMKTASAARLLKAMSHEIRQRFLTQLSEGSYYRIQRLLVYPSGSAGALMDPVGLLLPDTILISDAKKRIENTAGLVACEIYVINDEYKLAGVVELNKLMSERPKLLIKEVMNKSDHAIPARTGIRALVDYKPWKSFKTLPVIESDNTVVGILKHKDVLAAVSNLNSKLTSANSSEDMLAMAGFYWNALTDVMDTVLSLTARRNETDEG